MADQPPLLYHEKQVAALCGQHALNTLLQGPYFTEVDLSQIAHELDAMEQSFMAESGMDTKAYSDWQKEESGNVANDGMFSIQVLSKALANWDLSCLNLQSPEAVESKEHPEKEQAFICNLKEHWLTVRRVHDCFYNFNSLYGAPEFLGDLYLTAFLATLREQGYSIFVVKGQLPHTHPDAGSEDTPGKWFTPQQAKESTRGAVKARESGYLKAAISNIMEKATQEGTMVTLKTQGQTAGNSWKRQRDWSPNSFNSGSQDTQDEDLARAIAASLGNPTEEAQGRNAGLVHDFDDEDPDLAAALAASMADTSGQASTSTAQQEEADMAAARLATLDPGQEPAVGPRTVDLALRLPNGDRLMRRFMRTERIQEVLNFLRWKGTDVTGHVLTAFPSKELRDPQQTLKAAGLVTNETLTLVKKK